MWFLFPVINSESLPTHLYSEGTPVCMHFALPACQQDCFSRRFAFYDHYFNFASTLLSLQSAEQQRNHFSGSQRRIQVSDAAEENVRATPKPHSDMCFELIMADILYFSGLAICLAEISATIRLLKLKMVRLRARRLSRSFT